MSKSQRLVLIVSILASFVAFLDIAIVNVGLPAIQRDLGGGLAAQQWVVDAYLITLGSLILIAGSLSDLLGRKRILKIGLVGFGIASALCALAPNNGFLIAARTLQGMAGALLVPSSLAIIISTFSGPAQSKAIGTWTAWTGISFILGPLIGGFLVDEASWRWIFAINLVPIAITLWLMRGMKLAQDKPKKTPIDFFGAALCALGLGGAVFALIEEPHYSWSDPLIYVPLIAGLLLFAAFLWHEAAAKYPMLPFSLFKNHNFSIGNIATVAVYAALTASTFLITVYIQQVGGYSALQAGLSLIPVTILLFLLSPRFGALSGKYGPRWFMAGGPIIAGFGFLLMLNLGTDINYWRDLLPGVLIFGLGLSITVAPLTSAILGDVDKSQAGIASAVNNAVARVAGLIAVAVIGALVATQFISSLNSAAAALPNSSASLSQAFKNAGEAPLTTFDDSSLSQSDASTLDSAIKGASETAFKDGIYVIALLMFVGGAISAIGIRNPRNAS